MAVGAAQQDKARRKSLTEQRQRLAAQEPAPTTPAEPERRREVSYANPADYGMPDLPKRESLPCRRASVGSQVFSTDRSSSAASGAATVKPELQREAKAFNDLLSGYSLDLRLDEPVDVRRDGQSIATMWTEMQQVHTDTTPSPMPAEALERSIQRQIDNIQQIHFLMQKNDTVIDHLEDVLT
ncbi:hypothetical protein STCU_02510 [Strigomonas culicis]|nr:hypothetical protein STCU_02510 [Strigomonas culicis]|eukprot:EPY33057.1 hypothetical protein STCU_02510 [Strigomonas culicis]